MKKKIYKIIKDLNPNKAHGHDEISIRMIKLCGKSITEPLINNLQNINPVRHLSKSLEERKCCSGS